MNLIDDRSRDSSLDRLGHLLDLCFTCTADESMLLALTGTVLGEKRIPLPVD